MQILFHGNSVLSISMILLIMFITAVYAQRKCQLLGDYKKYNKEYELLCVQQEVKNQYEIEGK